MVSYKTRFIFKVFFSGVLFGLMIQQVNSQTYSLPEKGLCAHRGAMASHPENTLPAFHEAIKAGAQMIEFDVQFSKDSALVIMHDGTVDRTTNGSGSVSDLTLAELKELDAGSWKGKAFKGTDIPVLAEVLEIMPCNIWLNVHLKGGESLGKKVAELILETGREHQAFLAVQSADRKGAISVSPNLLICNMERLSGGKDYVESTVEMKAEFIQLRGEVKPEFREYARQLHQKGIKVNYFGTDKAEEIELLFDLGIDFLLVNDITTSIIVARDLGIEPVIPKY